MRRLALIVLAAGLVAGCGSDEEKAPSRTTSAPALSGSYERMMSAADIARTDARRDEGGPGQEKPKPGRLELRLDDATMAMTDVGAAFTVRQDFSATSDGDLRLGAYLAPEKGAFCGPDVPATATYAWKLAGDVLTLEARGDECADRDSSLTGAWRRSG